MARPAITIACSAHPPGDIRIYSRWLLGLHAAGFKVSLIAPEIEPIPEIPPGVEFVPVTPYKRYVDRITHAGRITEPLARLAPDIVLYPDPELHNEMLRYRRNSGCVMVFDKHENFDQPETLFQGGGMVQRLIARAYPFVERGACRQLDGVIVVIPSMLRNLPDGTNAVVAHNYPSRAVIEALATPDENREQRFTAVNLGAVQASRGYMEYFQITDMLVNQRGRSDFSLCIGGQWDPGIIEEAQEYIREHKLDDHVTLVAKRVAHHEVVELYQSALIGLSPYLDNAKARAQLQNKVVEFMAAGLPVITSPSSVNRDLIKASGGGVLYWISELSKIADTIESWMDDPDEARRIGALGQDYARKNLVWEHELERVMPWLEQLHVNRRGG